MTKLINFETSYRVCDKISTTITPRPQMLMKKKVFCNFSCINQKNKREKNIEGPGVGVGSNFLSGHFDLLHIFGQYMARNRPDSHNIRNSD